ncbi:hypothetical protein K443DRAFT_537860 [Laccaria amethystina LaAM-08-1]|uniref:Uncharacterized protein n=1 Tax=Laccaria amethystina LaAM-08-1 TaxID=1095629 RepID=A0A0C9WZ49_9AGAR|nr:hypothetical protein K443DRAFT_537860 [Laccaria amethystina LaAM-08-1]
MQDTAAGGGEELGLRSYSMLHQKIGSGVYTLRRVMPVAQVGGVRSGRYPGVPAARREGCEH